MTTLIISEKNKAAQAIAEALGTVQKINVSKYLSVYYIPTKDIYVLPLRGHIQQYQNSKNYQKWTSSDPREIITNPQAIEKIPSNYAGPYISALKKYGQKCDLCVIGTDADVEGCNIGIKDALPFVVASNPKIKVLQLWLNDLQKKSIQTAYQNLIPAKWTWADSGEARAIIDAIIGFSATREVSLALSPLLKTINVKFTSIGRVQTSLLYLLYLRENIIRNFKSDPFWTLSAKIQIKDRLITAQHSKNNFTDKNIALQIYDDIKGEKFARIITVRNSTRNILPPTPLNTSKALLLITQQLKIDAKLALKMLEELYLNKIISYPRTDTDVYSDIYDHSSLLQKFGNTTNFGNFASDLISRNKVIPKQGKTNAGDHSPITPIKALDPSSSLFENDLQKKVYDLIARSYLALFGEPATEADSKILFKIKNEDFIASVSILVNPGFYKIAPFLAKKYDVPIEFLDVLKKLEKSNPENPQSLIQFPINKILFEEKETQPPPRYTDTTILKLMEQKNLGTKSTRPAILQILLDRTYIERKKRAIFVTELGFLLIEALIKVWEPFLKPNFTAQVEQKLEEIQQGKLQMNVMVNEVIKEFLILFDKFRSQKSQFLSQMNVLKQTGNVIRGRNNTIVKSKKSSSRKVSPNFELSTGLCPKCKKEPMKLVKSDTKRFFVCNDPNCKTFLSLPKKGSITMLKALCSICKFNIIKVGTSINGKKSQYYICPLCWTRGLKNQSGEGFCSGCRNFKIEKSKCVKK